MPGAWALWYGGGGAAIPVPPDTGTADIQFVEPADVPLPPGVEREPATYRIALRDPSTLELLGFLTNYAHASWTRRCVEPGEFAIHAPRWSLGDDREDISALLPQNVLVDIQRDTGAGFVAEFEGIGRIRTLPEAGMHTAGEVWEISGQDLKWWLEGRVIWAALADDEVLDVPAETAVKHYLDANLGRGAGVRDVEAEIAVPFIIESDGGRGATVSFHGRWQPLLSGCVADLALQGGFWHEVHLLRPSAAVNPSAYFYHLHEYRERENVIIDPGFRNLAALRYAENMISVANAIYVLGEGEGAARAITTVEDISARTGRFRRERAIDARSSDGEAERATLGRIEIERAIAEAISVEAQPHTLGPYLYRADYDLGDVVTVRIAGVAEAPLRIAEVSVALARGAGDAEVEQVTLSLGAPPITVANILRRLERQGRATALQ